jgi:bifunctional UDP-N-acetylglucosamine pyrophosphorylase/glucosamine-1-phosphate N-acetyltransferase
VLVAYADVPLITPAALQRLYATHRASGAAITLLTMDLDDPAEYGRIVRSAEGGVVRIVEAREAGVGEGALKEANTGIGVYSDDWLWTALTRLRPSAATGELYLTDLVALAVDDGTTVAAVTLDDPREGQGVNTRADLATVEAVLRDRIRRSHLDDGVTMVAPESTWIDMDVEIGRDTVIWPGTFLLGRTSVGAECTLGPGAYISDSRLADGAVVRYSVVEESEIGEGCSVGPFAHLRSGVRMAAGSRAGTHAELKNATLGEGARVSHFSYVGDAEVGAGVNIGAGTVTANFDGVAKHRTQIGEGAFVGSGTMLVAPVSVGAGARTGAGSVITTDVAPGVTVAGVPARQLAPRPAPAGVAGSDPEADEAESDGPKAEG